MPGNIFKVECKPGQAVKAGDVLIVLEAMKMEIEVSAPVDGTDVYKRQTRRRWSIPT